jgi:hypothetical protein
MAAVEQVKKIKLLTYQKIARIFRHDQVSYLRIGFHAPQQEDKAYFSSNEGEIDN